MRVVVAVTAFVGAWVLLVAGIEPGPTWFYVFAWYPLLLLMDTAGMRLDGKPSWLFSPRALSLFAWSAVIWLLYEAVNFRIQNLYYVYLPANPVERWLGITASFATVLPALFLAARMLEGIGFVERWQGKFAIRTGERSWPVVTLGITLLAAALIAPRWCSALTWGAGLLIADPYVRLHRPEDSLLADVSRGEWRRVGRLIGAGLAVGIVWEGLNWTARAKWIYTVPILEQLKLFEMPPLGFIGFPVFALSAWSLYHALVVAGVAAAMHRTWRPDTGRMLVASLGACVFVFVVMRGMETRTTSSLTPFVADLPAATEPAVLNELISRGIDSPWDLARRTPEALAGETGLAADLAAGLVHSAQLATLRGIGTGHAVELERAGIRTVCDLAEADPFEVWMDIHALFRGLGPRPTAAEVRVWHRAAAVNCSEP